MYRILNVISVHLETNAVLRIITVTSHFWMQPKETFTVTL
jgi:hypothetical protein